MPCFTLPPCQDHHTSHDWPGLLSKGQPWPLSEDPNAYLTLDLYQSLVAKIQDDQQTPVLQSEPLPHVQIYSKRAQAGVFPFWLAQSRMRSKPGKAYSDQPAQWLATWFLFTLNNSRDTSAMPLASLGSNSFTLADGC